MVNPYFKREEFACQCGCGQCGVDAELLDSLTKIREHFNAPVTITSGNRCIKHNASVGGAENSKHVAGIAADFKVSGVCPAEVASTLHTWYPGKYGIGVYPSWVHLDVREQKARW